MADTRLMTNLTTPKKKGRPASSNPMVFYTIGMTAEQWAWLELWHPGGNRTDQMKDLLYRAQKFWPAGPAKFR